MRSWRWPTVASSNYHNHYHNTEVLHARGHRARWVTETVMQSVTGMNALRGFRNSLARVSLR